jgi:hypothetical protein
MSAFGGKADIQLVPRIRVIGCSPFGRRYAPTRGFVDRRNLQRVGCAFLAPEILKPSWTQVRVGDQPQDRQGAWPHDSARRVLYCRRGDRMNGEMSASLIGRLGSSTFRLSAAAVSMSLTGSCFSSESAPRPFHHGIRRQGGAIFWSALPADERQVQADIRTHLIHRPARDIIPPLGGARLSSYCV